MTAYWQTMVADIHGRRAEQHRPQDRATLRAAAVELQQRGLTVEDIGQALGLSLPAVRELLEVPE